VRFPLKKDDFEQGFTAALREADRQGILSPVVTVYQPDSRGARLIYADAHGRPMPARWRARRRGPGPIDALALPRAIDLLRLHGGIGGAAVAAVLEITPERPHHWLLVLYREHLAIRAFGEEELLIEGNLHYDQLPVRVCDRIVFAPRTDSRHTA
jgi:hypothetical protein